MAHQRKLIRQATVALLTGKTSAADRVFGTRIDPFRTGKVPAISVYALGEETDMDLSAQSAPREITRKLHLEVVGFVAHRDSYSADDAMDDIAEQIEAAMDSDRWLSGLTPPSADSDKITAAECVLESTVMELQESDGKSDPIIGFVALTYAVTYRTSPADSGSAADFTDADVTTEVQGGVTDTVKAEDDFNPQETP